MGRSDREEDEVQEDPKAGAIQTITNNGPVVPRAAAAAADWWCGGFFGPARTSHGEICKRESDG